MKFSIQNRLATFALCAVFLAFIAVLATRYFNFNPAEQLGYFDPQLYWQSLSDLASGKVIYRDFFWEYGWLYLTLGVPFFLALGRSFLAVVLIRRVIFPTISIVLSFLLGRELLKKRGLAIFLFLILLYGTGSDFTSLRHLIPELGLLLLILGGERNDRWRLIIGSGLIGLSLLSSIEYGVAAITGLGVYFLISLAKREPKEVLIKAAKSTGIITLIAAPYFVFLLAKGAIGNFITFTAEYVASFYHLSPCRELFPRPNDGVDFLRRINLYAVPLILVGSLGVLLRKWRSNWFQIFTPLLTFSLLLYYRTLNTPCLGYLNYGLTFLFLIPAFIVTRTWSSRWVKIGAAAIIAWLIVTAPIKETLIDPIKTGWTRTRSNVKTEYLSVAGVYLPKELTESYRKTTELITENTVEDDQIFVYPTGPYYQLSGRDRPTNISTTWHYDLSSSLVELTRKQLGENPPKLVVINALNSWSIKTTLNQLRYNVHRSGDDVTFEGIITPVEEFISQNYRFKEKTTTAWILEKRDKPDPVDSVYLPAEESQQWQISASDLEPDPFMAPGGEDRFRATGRQPLIQLSAEGAVKADLVKIPVKFDLGFFKPLSKFIIEILGVDSNGGVYLLNRQLASGDWQDVWAYLPNAEPGESLESLVIRISDNRGFLWWGTPSTITVKPPEIYQRNKKLEIAESAF